MNAKKAARQKSEFSLGRAALAGIFLLALACALGVALPYLFGVSYSAMPALVANATDTPETPLPPPPLDKRAYDERLLSLAHVATSSPWYWAFLAGTTTPLTPQGEATTTALRKPLWPVRAAYPADGRASLPQNRIVAYYGNFYSTGMGILGEFPEDVVLARLREAADEWKAADPATPVIPAIEYIAVTAQGSAGKDGKYRLRMPDSQIDKALEMAGKVNGIVILDIQVGLSTLPQELPLLEKYLAMPQVHLALDPEFSMKDGVPPGDEIGTMNAADINYASELLAKLVDENHLPPKVLIVHRFTEEMVTGYKQIKTLPEVQIVMNMDGWGFPAKKVNTYNSVIYPEPVQLTGIKLFYKNDIKQAPHKMLTPAEVLALTPAPVYVQYQ